MQLAGAKLGRPLTPELGEVTTYLIEGRAIAPVVAARLAKGDSAAVKHLPHNGGDFADAVILPVVTDVEDLVMHGLARRFESEDNRLTNVIDMDQRSPRRSIAGHLDLFDGPGESGEIVEDDIETHARAGAECRCVAQEHGREMGVGERADIAFDQHFALGIGGLRIRRRSLVALASVLGRTVDAARGGIDKTRDTGLLAGPRQRDRADVVDLVGCAFAQLTEWVIRQLGKVNDRVEPFDILRGNLAHVLSEGERTRAVIVVKPAIAVKAAINPDNVKPPLHELRPENGADISIDTRNQYSHSRHFCPAKKSTAEIAKATLQMALHQVPW